MDEQSLLPVLSRRGFLKVLGAGAVVVFADARNLFDGNVFAALEEVDGVLTTRLIRPDDQLGLRFEFVNLIHDSTNPNLLVSAASGTPLMRLTLARQHVSEQPVAVGVTPLGAGSAPIPHRVSGPSRLVFEVTPPLELSVPVLLDLARHALVTPTTTGNPTLLQSMIEVPADLRLAPGTDVEMVADIAPITSGRVSQLHRIVLTAPGPIEMTPVHNAANVDGFLRRIPNAADRGQIVSLAGAEGPAVAERMWLTPHGAWADLAGEWSSISWYQNIRGGRDQFVQVVNRGILMPFGHGAVWTQTSTRLWLVDADGDVVSTMVTDEQFAVVGSSTLTFPVNGAPSEGRNMPLRSVTIEQKDSLAVEKGAITWDGGSLGLGDAWIVNYAPGPSWGGTPVPVSYSATDDVGNDPATFSLPAVFVRTQSLTNPSVQAGLVAFYGSDAAETVRRTSLRADIAWAEEEDPGSGLTTFLTKSIDFGVESVTTPDPDQLPVAPVIRGGNVTKPEYNSSHPTPEQLDIEVVYSDLFLSSGNDLDDNPTRAFLDLVTPTNFPLGAEARAVMTPEIRAEQFNQSLGLGPALVPGGGAGTGDTWQPAEAFGDLATILRGVKFADIVAPILFDIALPGVDIPSFDVQTLPDRIVQTYRWCPDSISSVPVAGFIATASTSLCVEVTAVIGLTDTVEASSTVVFEVDDFTLVVPPLINLIELDVNSMKAVQTSSGNTDLTFDIGDWRLGGALSWLEPLIVKLSPGGSDFDIDIVSDVIVADLELSLPNIALGVLVIKNFTIGLTGSFPFTGTDEPTFAIAVGTRVKPVTLQIQQFRGGFWCEVVFSPQGLELLHVHADATAMLVEIDIVIAKAYCYVTIGADFTLDGGDVTFTGYLSLSAGFSVLGLVGATLEIVGRVTYREAAEEITVSGTIYWSVTAITTFGGSLPLGAMTFSTGDGATSGFGPRTSRALPSQASSAPVSGSFGDAHTLATWRTYVDKFAPEPA